VEHQGKVFMGCDYNIDETYLTVKGEWRYLYRAVDKHGQTIDFLLAEHRDNEEYGPHIIIRQVKYLNTMVEQDHRGVKRVTRPMLGFKSFDAAQDTLVGIELMHMSKKRQLMVEAGDEGLTAAEQFYSLAA